MKFFLNANFSRDRSLRAESSLSNDTKIFNSGPKIYDRVSITINKNQNLKIIESGGSALLIDHNKNLHSEKKNYRA